MLYNLGHLASCGPLVAERRPSSPLPPRLLWAGAPEKTYGRPLIYARRLMKVVIEKLGKLAHCQNCLHVAAKGPTSRHPVSRLKRGKPTLLKEDNSDKQVATLASDSSPVPATCNFPRVASLDTPRLRHGIIGNFPIKTCKSRVASSPLLSTPHLPPRNRKSFKNDKALL